jgi:hypothetical protein
MSSFSKYVGNGAQTVFAVNQPMPSYSALEVTLDGEVVTVGFTYNRTNATVTFAVAPADGVVIKLSRVTQVEPLHKFATGAAFTARNVDTNFTQESYRVEELQDNVVGVKELEESVLQASEDAEAALAQLLASSTDYIQVGTFAAGYASLQTVQQTLLHSDGHRYGWTGSFPKTVPAGSTPTPLGAGGWIDRTDVVLRDDLLAGALRIRNDKFSLRDMVSVRDAGGVGDGVADDTAALQATIASNASFGLFDMELLAQPTGTSGAITKDAAIISGPGVFKVKPGSYASGTSGSVDSYSFMQMNADGGCVINTSFDGNGQATLLPYQPTGANVHFFPVIMYGGKKGQKAIGNHSTGAGGHAIEGGNGSLMLMLGNSADYHNGIGTTNTDSVVMAGMASANTTDSHYYSNSNHGVVTAAVVGSGSTGGGGIDIAGGSDAVVGASSFNGCKKHGAWVLKSPNTGEQYNRVLISGVLSHNNCLYPDDEQGEITIGDQLHPSDAQGADAAVVGNLLCPRDTPSGAGYNAGVWVHKGSTRTAGVANVFSPDDALISGNQPVIRDMGSTKPIYASNVCFGGTSGKVYFDATPSGYSHYANNVNMRIHPLSKLPSAMEASDAVWPYHIVRPLTKAGIRLLEVSYTGGFVHDVIDITLTQTGDNGAAAYRVVLRGVSGLATAVLALTKLWEAGTNPPQVTVNAGVGIATVSANTAPSGFDGESCAFDIRVVTPQDEALRFKPIFSA